MTERLPGPSDALDTDWTGFQEREEETNGLAPQNFLAKFLEAGIASGKDNITTGFERSGASEPLRSLVHALEKRLAAARAEIGKLQISSWYDKVLEKTPILSSSAFIFGALIASHARTIGEALAPITAYTSGAIIGRRVYAALQVLKWELPSAVASVVRPVIGEKAYTALAKKFPQGVNFTTALALAIVGGYAIGAATERYSQPFLEWVVGGPIAVKPPMGPQVSAGYVVPEVEVEKMYLETLDHRAQQPFKLDVRNITPPEAVEPLASIPPTPLSPGESPWSTFVVTMRDGLLAAEIPLSTDGEQSFAQAFQRVASERSFQNALLNRVGPLVPWDAIKGPVYFDRLFSDPNFIDRLSALILKEYPTLVREIPPSMEVRQCIELIARRFTERHGL